MQRLRWQTLAACFVVAGTLSAIGLRWWTSRGNTPVPTLPSHIVWLVVLAVVVALLGLRIRRYLRHGQELDPIGATRTLALAQAGAVTGALHVGFFAAQFALALTRLHAPDPRQQAWTAVAALLASGVLIAAGLIAEWCCRVPPEDEDDGDA